jgi:hypothetical protein
MYLYSYTYGILDMNLRDVMVEHELTFCEDEKMDRENNLNRSSGHQPLIGCDGSPLKRA